MGIARIVGAALMSVVALMVAAEPAQAASVSRLGGLVVYDTDRDISWVANGDLNGLMAWDDAVAWADNLVYAGFDDWRLPVTLHPDASCDDPMGTHGFHCTGSEMGHLFYEELGVVANQPVWTSPSPSFGLFTNLEAARYWSGTRADFFAPTHSWTFWFESGREDPTDRSLARRALAVRDGDVLAGPVPEPGSAALFAIGLVAAALRRRRRR